MVCWCILEPRTLFLSLVSDPVALSETGVPARPTCLGWRVCLLTLLQRPGIGQPTPASEARRGRGCWRFLLAGSWGWAHSSGPEDASTSQANQPISQLLCCLSRSPQPRGGRSCRPCIPRVGTRNPRCWSPSKVLTNDFETCLLGPRDQPWLREVPSRQLAVFWWPPPLPSLPPLHLFQLYLEGCEVA